MVQRLFALTALLALSCCYTGPGSRYGHQGQVGGPEPVVRVRLIAFSESAELSCAGRSKLSVGPKTRDLAPGQRVSVGPEGVQVNGAKWAGFSDTLRLEPAGAELVKAGERTYRGSLAAFTDASGKLAVVNVLGLEEYLQGVVPCEIGPAKPETFAALKAQAVCARSFTLTRLDKRPGLGHQLFDTYARDQEYRGVGSELELTNKAVAETRGEVLLYQGRPAEALYHGNCGGITGQGSQPYLVPVRDGRGTPFCAHGKYHKWQAEFSPAQYETTLARLAGMKGRLVGASLEKEPVSGRVKKLRLVTDSGTFPVNGSDFRMALGLRSTMFELAVGRDGHLKFSGKGWGHGSGLCQDGAIGMARQRYDYRRILGHYYPRLKLGRWY